ncbi:hypothetical protein [Curtobacterium flaccumfaciens]|uniref:hypothetical protein n=1 Tax=Curtobacterium flaccumfaciens TaxID=2035 RepID=UPI00265A6561|nr:hypothetical protein [Curtobacterium flaccumfaciens]MCS0491199.1 hypothetical protein [Curtobacterium flaccumfaciens pv. betae]
MTSTDDGWTPIVGELVIERMWAPDCTGQAERERGQRERRYGEDKVMRLAGVWEHYDMNEYARSLGADLAPRFATSWWLVDPARPNDESRWSWVNSDWAELLPVQEPAHAGMLF